MDQMAAHLRIRKRWLQSRQGTEKHYRKDFQFVVDLRKLIPRFEKLKSGGSRKVFVKA